VPHGDKTRLARALGVKGDVLRDTARKLVIFEGDAECYKVVKEASDGFEHGFMPLDQIRSHALAMRDQTMTHLRSAILTIARLDDVVRAQLMDRPFDFPYPNIGLVKYVKGAIVGKSDNLAADGYEYPLLQWQTTPQTTVTDTPGTYSITFQDTIEPYLLKKSGGVTTHRDTGAQHVGLSVRQIPHVAVSVRSSLLDPPSY